MYRTRDSHLFPPSLIAFIHSAFALSCHPTDFGLTTSVRPKGAGNQLIAAFSEVQNWRYYGRRGRGRQGKKAREQAEGSREQRPDAWIAE